MNLNKDYTQEIMRCIDFIVLQIQRGWSVQESVMQAEGSYGYAITLNARRALERNVKNGN